MVESELLRRPAEDSKIHRGSREPDRHRVIETGDRGNHGDDDEGRISSPTGWHSSRGDLGSGEIGEDDLMTNRDKKLLT